MRFSDHFGIKRSKSDTWFDPILSVDTPLFIDPFLLYALEEGVFKGSHGEIIRFFNTIFKIIALSGGKSDSVRYKKSVNDLLFPEVDEICLGYAQGTTKGLGSGRVIAKVIAEALWEAVKAGMTEITHFEEVTILREGIGADRISDITAWLLRKRLSIYTTRICRSHGIPTKKFGFKRGQYDSNKQKWMPLQAELPYNPYNGKPILLIPSKYLRDLPTFNADDFWDFCYSNENKTLRNEYSYDVTHNVSKHEIVSIARKHPEFRQKYVRRLEKRKPKPYDLNRDRKGLIKWYDATAKYCRNHSLSFAISSNAAFFQVIDEMLQEFQHFVEQNSGWRLLWNDNGMSKGEKAAQLLLLGIVKHYCKANNIDISPEANIGRGPVDFKVSMGHQLKVLIEVKLARNTRYWDGITKQLPAYLKAEKIKSGYFLFVILSDEDEDRATRLSRRLERIGKTIPYKITLLIVDARNEKPSASKL